MNNKKVVFIVLCSIFFIFLYFFFLSKEEVPLVAPLEFSRVANIADTRIFIAIADSISEQIQGLSLQKELKDNHGLLFLFDTEGGHPIWMKDMLFSIDVLWLDRQNRVVFIYENFSPESFPLSVSSPVSAIAVLEVPAGFVEAQGIKVGDALSF